MPPIEMYLSYPNKPVETKKISAGESIDKRIKDIKIHIEGDDNGGSIKIKHDSQQKPKIYEMQSGEKLKIKKTVIEKGGKKETFTLKFTGK